MYLLGARCFGRLVVNSLIKEIVRGDPGVTVGRPHGVGFFSASGIALDYFISWGLALGFLIRYGRTSVKYSLRCC